jgi:Restriction endonuclease S subunits
MEEYRIENEDFISLPDRWTLIGLEELAINPQQDIVDGPFGSDLKASEYVDRGIPIIRLQNIDRDFFIDKNIKFITEEKSRELERHNFISGDIVITKLGDPLGEACEVPSKYNHGIIVADIVRVRLPWNLVNKKYIVYGINSPIVVNQFSKATKGTTRPRVNLKFIRGLKIPLSPIAEQRRIVAKIEELFTQLDAAEAALKRAKANLERYQQSVLQAASSGQLVEQNPDDEPASFTIRRVWADRKQSQPKIPFPIDDLPQLPHGWCWTSIEQLTDGSKYSLKAGPFGSALKKEYYVPTGYKIYGQEQVIRGDPYYGDYYINQDLFEKLQSCEVKPGDVLISLVGTIGKVLILPSSIEPGIINPRLLKFSFDFQIIDSRYFKYYLESQTARDYFSIASHGQTMDVLNLGILKGLPIPLPPPNEQKRIIMEVEKSETLVESQNTVIDKSLSRSKKIRQSILEEAFSGRLVDQNPDDEPASILLQRIQAERQETEKQKAAKPKKEKKKMTEETKRRSLFETLQTAGKRLTPEELFKRAGFNEESVDEFYEELRQEIQIEADGHVVKHGRIKEERPNQAYIYLSEVKS